MEKKGRSERNLFGGYTHYDAKGHKVGRSAPGLFGGYTNYDAKGHKIGRSAPGLFGGYTHYDAKGHKIGHTDPRPFGSYVTFDAKGNKTGESDPDFAGGYTHHEAACYIATCVYGSYDCPQVWTLRRFRDFRLARSRPGRLFIRVYYAVSPAVVRRFGGNRRFRAVWRAILDRLVCRLRGRGFADTPYDDLEASSHNSARVICV